MTMKEVRALAPKPDSDKYTLAEYQRDREATLRRPIREELRKMVRTNDIAAMKAVLGAELVADAADGLAKAVRGEWPWNKPQTWAIDRVLELVGLVNRTPDVQVQFLQMIGVSMGDARRAVDMVREIEQMDPRAQALECREFLVRYNSEHPEETVSL
jgi:hypothetical protein